MAPSKTKVDMPGVAPGKDLTGVSTDDDLSSEEKVTGMLGNTFSPDTYEGWGAALIPGMELVSAEASPAGKVVFSYTCQVSDCNRLGNMHGGCISTLFDVCTTMALVPIAKPGFWAYMGVSRTLNVTFLRPVPLGEKILIESEVVHAGKRLSSLKGTMKREKDGAVLALCEHGKVSIDPEITKL